jgi:HK97 family phage major capsid protein
MANLRSLAEHVEHEAELRARVAAIDEEYAGDTLPDEVKEEWNALNEEIDTEAEVITQLRRREERVRELMSRDENTEAGSTFGIAVTRTDAEIYDVDAIYNRAGTREQQVGMFRDNAMRAIENLRSQSRHVKVEEQQEHLQRMVDNDGHGEIAHRILTTGSKTYAQAFGKALQGDPLNPEQQRALSTAGAGGGFAVPFALDPTLIHSSNFSVNPYRAIARVVTITGANTWEGVTAGAITATYQVEGGTVSDNSPVLTQPVATVQRCSAFVPYSFEIEGDWAALGSEMAQLFADAKDDVEAIKFTNGSGTTEPQGVITGATTANRVQTVGTAAFAIGDVYAIEAALAPRWRPRATFVGSRFIYQKVRQFDTAGGASLWVDNFRLGLANQVPTPGNIGSTLLGYPAMEASTLGTALTSATNEMIFGDFSRGYVIVDRVGMSIELVPIILQGGLPTGQRGMMAWWRNTAVVAVPAAFKYLATL